MEKEISVIKQHRVLVTDEKNKITSVMAQNQSVFAELLVQRDTIEKQIIDIKSSNNKCCEEIEGMQATIEDQKINFESKEKQLKKLLEEYKALTENHHAKVTSTKSMPQTAKKTMPKMEMRPFPASSFSFNISVNKNSSRDRISLNKSVNSVEYAFSFV